MGAFVRTGRRRDVGCGMWSNKDKQMGQRRMVIKEEDSIDLVGLFSPLKMEMMTLGMRVITSLSVGVRKRRARRNQKGTGKPKNQKRRSGRERVFVKGMVGFSTRRTMVAGRTDILRWSKGSNMFSRFCWLAWILGSEREMVFLALVLVLVLVLVLCWV
ncbi:hypothetical protein TREMEDRAFT_65235 [Tremella mesenterica DSM 1558]|uniref:uncharacterized protein n=1 Tax=Tremella mesenterica (strain ATCC 24925 / CBS 8224 / DSM 1558 / NBRC 9311 / NRRL Y-6157 / RJB 2259-6 / UBC 559-6) TaxID=578456 RepID=UPI00032D3B44|nr:uncharacterized protein TREMEDRAFT_65235 [Tremella mesenterica DSM 1558]EIW66832.1 hypothetical protein TREMEDRAFT_65235 [Tremella mesenterica DSM 1558]